VTPTLQISISGHVSVFVGPQAHSASDPEHHPIITRIHESRKQPINQPIKHKAINPLLNVSWLLAKSLRKRDHTLFLGSGVHPGPRRNEKSNRNVEHNPKSFLTDPPKNEKSNRNVPVLFDLRLRPCKRRSPQRLPKFLNIAPRMPSRCQLSTILGNLASHLGHSRYQLQSYCCYFRRRRARPTGHKSTKTASKTFFVSKLVSRLPRAFPSLDFQISESIL